MKLTTEQVKQTITQLGAQVLPDEHPAMPQLNSMFGEHTFFVDESGLKVLEPTPSLGADRETGEVVSLADWSDAELTRLMAHEPEPTGVIVVFEHVRHRFGSTGSICSGGGLKNSATVIAGLVQMPKVSCDSAASPS